jgi:hypothetical protein
MQLAAVGSLQDRPLAGQRKKQHVGHQAALSNRQDKVLIVHGAQQAFTIGCTIQEHR